MTSNPARRQETPAFSRDENRRADDGHDAADMDAYLVQRAKAELPYITTAYERLVSRHLERTIRHAQTIVGNRDDAESIAQDAMLRVHAALPRFRGDCRLTTWLHRITENVCRTHLAREQREAAKRAAYAVGADISDDAVNAEAPDRLDAILDDLPIHDRTLLALRLVEDLELQQIAEIMGLGLSATKMRYYRLLDRLRERMDDECALTP